MHLQDILSVATALGVFAHLGGSVAKTVVTRPKDQAKIDEFTAKVDQAVNISSAAVAAVETLQQAIHATAAPGGPLSVPGGAQAVSAASVGAATGVGAADASGGSDIAR